MMLEDMDFQDQIKNYLGDSLQNIEWVFWDISRELSQRLMASPDSQFRERAADISDVSRHLPAVDIRETKNAYVLEAELPGYDEENIQVYVDGGTLTIESKQDASNTRDVSEKKGAVEKEEKVFVIRERRRSSFTRSFKLPENTDPDTISADFKNGILSLEIKKRTESQKRIIPIAKVKHGAACLVPQVGVAKVIFCALHRLKYSRDERYKLYSVYGM
jgi:HSP20 family protein